MIFQLRDGKRRKISGTMLVPQLEADRSLSFSELTASCRAITSSTTPSGLDVFLSPS